MKHELKFRQVEAAVIDLFFGRRDQPHMQDIAKSLDVPVSRLTAYLKHTAQAHGLRYLHWRQFRDQLLARHGFGRYVPLGARYGDYEVFIPHLVGETWIVTHWKVEAVD